MCLGNISRDFSTYNMKKNKPPPLKKNDNNKQTKKTKQTQKQKDTGLNEWVYRFSIDCRAFDTGDIIDIHKNFNERTWYKTMFKIIKKFLLDY